MSQSYKYITSLPKPLLDDFIHNKVVPFVGAGFSKNADIPDGLSMPEWNELGKKIANEIPNYKFENNALDTISYYEMLFSRPKLIELLMRELNVGKVRPGDTYTAFCEVFTETVCTTNFDFLLEDAFRILQQPISVIATEDRLSIATEGETRLIKLHGDFNHPDRMVVTEHDYDIYIESNPVLATYISNLFITKTMLLIGYSLDDYDFRNLWQIINSRLGKMKRPAYCITVGASPEKIARYQRRDIKVINLEGKVSDYKIILRDFFRELKKYIITEKTKHVISTDEKINEKLLLPSESNRLCFISCAMPRISQLKNVLYPVLQEIGITPVRIDDILMPGDNWMDIARAAIRKSNMAIIDVSDNSSNVLFELGVAQEEMGKEGVILIAEKGSVLPTALLGYDVLTYTFDWINELEEMNNFQSLLRELCNTIIDDNLSSQPLEEAKRLLKKNEFSACIVSIFSDLELLLQTHRRNSTFKNSISLLKELATTDNSNLDSQKVQEYWTIRNKIVHGGYKAKKREAKSILEFAERLI